MKFLRIFNLDQKTYVKKIGHKLFLYVRPIDHIEKNIFWYGHYEFEATRIWQSFINNNSVIIDIGANIGYYSIISASKATNGKVIAFEPVSYTYRQLLQNIVLNNLVNITTFPFALFNKKETIQVFISEEDNIGMSGLTKPKNFSGKSEYTSAITLEEFIENSSIAHVDQIKIDVEGAEFNVLQGMQNILKIHKPVLMIEIIEELLMRFNYKTVDLYNFLSSFGYNAYEIVNENLISIINTPKEGENILFIHKSASLPTIIKILYPH